MQLGIVAKEQCQNNYFRGTTDYEKVDYFGINNAPGEFICVCGVVCGVAWCVWSGVWCSVRHGVWHDEWRGVWRGEWRGVWHDLWRGVWCMVTMVW